MKHRIHIRIVLAAFLSSVASVSFGQGPLTPPPGAPSPTMKTLDQIEPRTAITNLPISITNGGSYYLAQPIAQNFSNDAITIATNNVTLDLRGFTVQNTGSLSVNGISLINPTANGSIKNVVIKNGSIAGFSPAFGIAGFGTRNCVFEDLTITTCGESLLLQARGTAGAVGNIVRRCHICDSTAAGVVLSSGAANVRNLIQQCEALNDHTGFSLSSASNLIINCRASGNTVNYSIAVGNRGGLITQPSTNTTFSGSSGAVGTGTSDACLNVSY